MLFIESCLDVLCFFSASQPPPPCYCYWGSYNSKPDLQSKTETKTNQTKTPTTTQGGKEIQDQTHLGIFPHPWIYMVEEKENCSHIPWGSGTGIFKSFFYSLTIGFST